MGPVAQSLVSANRWLRGIKTHRFPWYLTLVRANHASSNPGMVSKLYSMDKLQPPSALAITGNLAENWRRFKQQFKIYEIASGLARKDGKVRAMTLLHVA